MTELWLVRHGQTDWNVIGRYQGQSDVPLNRTGLAQARALARFLAGHSFSAIYSSDLSRASQTAAVLGEQFGLPVILLRELREIRHGEWEGQTIAEVHQKYTSSWLQSDTRSLDDRAPGGGESTREVAARMAQAANRIAQAHPVGPVLVVSHGFSLATLVCQALGLPLSEVYNHIPDNATPKTIQWPGD